MVAIKTIVTLAMNPVIDMSSSVKHVIAEQKLRCTAPRYEPGGGGVNVSRAVKKLGGTSRLLYPAGGMTGQRLGELLKQEGIACRRVPIDGMTRESFVVLEESTGQQYRFGMPGPPLRRTEWERCLSELSAIRPTPDYVVASGSLPPGVPADFYARVARQGKRQGAKVIVDAAGEALARALREGVYAVKPNMREFRALVRRGVHDESQIVAQAVKMVKRGWCEVLVISLGAAGALMVSIDAVEHLRPPVVPIVSKVGAGDSMVAGLVLSLARGAPLRNSVLFGVAAGAAAVMTPGTELCRRKDVERLYATMRVQSASLS